MGRPKAELLGQTVSDFLVLSETSESAGGYSRYVVACTACNSEKVVYKTALLAKSVLCRVCTLTNHVRGSKSALYTHGQPYSIAYQYWKGMWNRCRRSTLYKDRMPPDSWRSYEVFMADVGEPPSEVDGGKTTLDRINNELPYGPGNVRWASYKVQQSNTSRNRYVVLGGETITLTEACRRLGYRSSTIYKRLAKSGDVNKAFDGRLDNSTILKGTAELQTYLKVATDVHNTGH